MGYLAKLSVEAISVGFIVVIIGLIVSAILGSVAGVDLPDVCKSWNKHHIMELSLFLTGVIVHLGCEFSGVNKWYLTNGAVNMRK